MITTLLLHTWLPTEYDTQSKKLCKSIVIDVKIECWYREHYPG
ncbi:MAG: hypothetical protein OFPII_42830 [Osedax symbiont Rs1]|nr:MAG: hypothetical protein OFPII_42830 [Osedax symbiont Rs1]